MNFLIIYFFIAIYFTSILFDIYCFYKISNIKIKHIKDIAFICIYLIVTVTLDSLLLNSGFIISDFLFLIFLFIIYSRKINDFELLFGAGLIPLIFDLTMDIISQIFFTLFSVARHPRILIGLFTIFMYFIAFSIIKKIHKKIHGQLVSNNKKLVLSLVGYFYISVLVVFIINVYINNKSVTAIIFSILLVLQLLFMALIFYFILGLQKQYIKNKEQEMEKNHQRQLEEYAGYLEQSEDELRAFRHDYRNMFNSLKVSAQEGNVQEVIDKLDKYTQTNLNSQALLKYKDVNHVHVKSIKSIIISKLTEMYNLGIKYNFECRKGIYSLPDHVDELDLVRIIGITCDNAIEESKALMGDGKKNQADIQIMFYSAESGEFEYEIRNKTRKSKISVKQIQKQGFTTKKNHQGLGLANVKQIEAKYPDMDISYTVENDWFDFYITIDTEDGE